MQWIARISIFSKLQLAPGLVILLLLLVSATAYYGLSQQQRLIDDIHSLRIKQYEKLNAAIEAARAGEQGRVVAREVRQLAEMSSSAANSIDDVTRSLTGQSAAVEQALIAGERALASSNHRLNTLEELFAGARSSVQEVFTGIDSMTSAVEEQSAGSRDIARSIELIAHMTDSSNEISRDTFDATQELKRLAEGLQATTAQFSV